MIFYLFHKKNVFTYNTHRLIYWCLTPNLAVFQLYHGMNKFYINLRHQYTWIYTAIWLKNIKENIALDNTRLEPL